MAAWVRLLQHCFPLSKNEEPTAHYLVFLLAINFVMHVLLLSSFFLLPSRPAAGKKK
jgi:hypothetical protein